MQRKSRKCCHSLTLTKQYNKTPSFDQFEGKKFEVNVIFVVRIIPSNKASFFFFLISQVNHYYNKLNLVLPFTVQNNPSL